MPLEERLVGRHGLDADGVAGEVIFPDADSVTSGASAPFGAGLAWGASVGEATGRVVEGYGLAAVPDRGAVLARMVRDRIKQAVTPTTVGRVGADLAEP